MKHYLRNQKELQQSALWVCFWSFGGSGHWLLQFAVASPLASAYIEDDIKFWDTGCKRPSRPEYARCLRERYNIEFRTVAGCVVSESLISYVNAYHTLKVVRRCLHGVPKLRTEAHRVATRCNHKWLAIALDVRSKK